MLAPQIFTRAINWPRHASAPPGRPYVGLCPIFLVTCVISFELAQHIRPRYINVTDGRTDDIRWYDSNTARCTMCIDRAVKRTGSQVSLPQVGQNRNQRKKTNLKHVPVEFLHPSALPAINLASRSFGGINSSPAGRALYSVHIHTTVWVKKIPPEIFWHFFPNGWEFLSKFYTPVICSYLR